MTLELLLETIVVDPEWLCKRFNIPKNVYEKWSNENPSYIIEIINAALLSDILVDILTPEDISRVIMNRENKKGGY